MSLHLSLPGEKLHYIRMEVRQNLQRSQVTAQKLVQLIGKLHTDSQAVLPAPFFLPVTTRRPSQNSEPHQPELRCIGFRVSSSPGRAYLVAGEAYSMEWQDSAVQATDNYHYIRCISPGLGSSLQWYQNRGPMEPLGAENAHKLPRVTGSNSSNKDLSEGLDKAIMQYCYSWAIKQL